MLGDPARDPLAELHRQLLGRLVDVFADLTLHRDRLEVEAAQAIDADVVVVDQLSELCRDREPDLPFVAEP